MNKTTIHLIHHFLIWVGLFFVFYFFSIEFYDISIAYKKTVVTVLPIGILITLNTYYLFPKLYLKQKTYSFWLWNLIFVALFTTTNYIAFELYFYRFHYSPLLSENFSFIFKISRYFLMYSILDYIAISILLFLQVKNQTIRNKQLEEEKANTELKLLKAQINPHFLFNALNNIYSLSYIQSKNTSESILKLSDMLRYVFYDCSKDKVKLSDEIRYIHNFISFQQIKTDYPQNISFSYEKTDVLIAPMILMPFIENSVKYSKIESEKDAFVNIRLSVEDNTIDFFIENSIAPKPPKQGTEMGLTNVKSRLDLLYPNNYTYEFDWSENSYSVHLNIIT